MQPHTIIAPFNKHLIIADANLFRDWLDGMLLSDGTIDKGKQCARFKLTQRDDRIEWLQMVKESFSYFGIESKFGIHTRPGKKVIQGRACQHSGATTLRTRSYSLFTKERIRWYPGDEKHVPHDVQLSPLAIAQWYAGDGARGAGGYHVTFYTSGFQMDDLQFLKEKLTDLYGWTPTITKNKNILLTNTGDRLSFYNMVSPYLPNCFAYKLNLKLVDKRRTLPPGSKEQAIALHIGGSSYTK